MVAGAGDNPLLVVESVKTIKSQRRFICPLICIAFSLSTFVLSAHAHWDEDGLNISSTHEHSHAACTLCDLGTTAGKFLSLSFAGFQLPDCSVVSRIRPDSDDFISQISLPFSSRAPPTPAR